MEPLCLKLEEIGALDSIESLQEHENEQVSVDFIYYYYMNLSRFVS